MPENTSWSLSVGRWFDIPVRYHFWLIAFCIVIIALEQNASLGRYHVFSGTALATVLILLVSIMLHEIAHAFAVKDVGGTIQRIVLFPWGGISDYILPNSPVKRGFVYLAGMLVNGLVFLMGGYLLIVSGNATLWQIINPLKPFDFDTSEILLSSLKILTWVNFQLFIFNLIPVYPFDGAQLLRNSFASVASGASKVRLESAIKVFGQGTAFAMIGLAIFLRDSGWGFLNCGWLLMLLGGVALIFLIRYSFDQMTSQESEWPDEDNLDLEPYYEDHQSSISYSGFDFSDDSDNSFYSNWLREKQEQKILSIANREEEEHQRLDSILEKLHREGLPSLSQEEREILNRVSARLRRRRQQGV
jgi:Zn-dependent protease